MSSPADVIDIEFLVSCQTTPGDCCTLPVMSPTTSTSTSTGIVPIISDAELSSTSPHGRRSSVGSVGFDSVTFLAKRAPLSDCLQPPDVYTPGCSGTGGSPLSWNSSPFPVYQYPNESAPFGVGGGETTMAFSPTTSNNPSASLSAASNQD